MIYLNGGADMFNVLVPFDDCYNCYKFSRGSVALTPDQLLSGIRAEGQRTGCNNFAVNKMLPTLRQLYNEGDLAFYTNIGQLKYSAKYCEENNVDTRDGNSGQWACSFYRSHADQGQAARRIQCGGG